MGTITLKFGGRRYDIALEDRYAQIEEECLKNIFHPDQDNDIKILLQAYLKQCHETYRMKEELETLLKKITSGLETDKSSS